MELPKFYIGQQIIWDSGAAKHMGTIANGVFKEDGWKYLLELHNDMAEVYANEKDIIYVLKEGKWDSTAESASYSLDLYS